MKLRAEAGPTELREALVELGRLRGQLSATIEERDGLRDQLRQALLQIEPDSHVYGRHARRAVPLGPDRTLTYLDTGEPIVVDPRSIDALNYILGWALEPDIMKVFQRALRHNSVVIDVGANFGLFTVKAASRAAVHGKVFAFEANPHTYEVLRHTLTANQLLDQPNVRIENALVGDRQGVGEINFSIRELGGASVHRSFTDDLRGRANVKAIRLDNAIPADLPVDLVKIDVEGHEPFVLLGMSEIIARSPNIKIVLEFFDSFFQSTYGGSFEVQKLVAGLGLNAWTIGPQGALTPVDPSKPLAGDHYVLLARSIDDIGEAGDDIVIDPGSLSVLQGTGATISDGVAQFNAARAPLLSRAGQTLFYGPYIRAPEGVRLLRFSGRIEGAFDIQIHDQGGARVISRFEIDTLEPLLIDIPAGAERLEILIQRRPESRLIHLSRLTLSR
jgi:FkbM family methyltransferase